jgi:hypothetical protein
MKKLPLQFTNPHCWGIWLSVILMLYFSRNHSRTVVIEKNIGPGKYVSFHLYVNNGSLLLHFTKLCGSYVEIALIFIWLSSLSSLNVVFLQFSWVYLLYCWTWLFVDRTNYPLFCSSITRWFSFYYSWVTKPLKMVWLIWRYIVFFVITNSLWSWCLDIQRGHCTDKYASFL